MNVDLPLGSVKNSLEDQDVQKSVRQERLSKAVSTVKTIQEDLLAVLQGLTVVQINLRVELIPLNRFNPSMTDATRTALENRLDLMNSRATVMDLRRKIEVAANSLRGMVNLRFEGDTNPPRSSRGILSPSSFKEMRAAFGRG